jgi:hypothetical protein
MNKLLALIIVCSILACSQDKKECEEHTMPYWANETNSRIEGENPNLRKAFKKIQYSKTNITPKNGFITLRLHISKTGKLCDLETFQINKDYEKTEFDSGTLIHELTEVAISSINWKRDKAYKTYNLIRIKIKNGKIEEIF